MCQGSLFFNFGGGCPAIHYRHEDITDDHIGRCLPDLVERFRQDAPLNTPDPQTFYGLSGLGDLVLTCTGDLSRNRTLGVRVGRGEEVADILAGMRMVAEGVETATAAVDLSRRTGVSMPISEQVHLIVHEGKDVRAAVTELLSRALRKEKD